MGFSTCVLDIVFPQFVTKIHSGVTKTWLYRRVSFNLFAIAYSMQQSGGKDKQPFVTLPIASIVLLDQ